MIGEVFSIRRLQALGTAALVLSVVACGPAKTPPSHTDEEEAKARTRSVTLAGESNFRDLGGYATTDGRSLKWGVLFRSGELHDLSDDDLQVVESLGVRTVVSFLTGEEEVARGRDRVPPGVRERAFPIEGGIAGELASVVLEARQSGDFGKVPVELNPELHRLLVELGADQYATLIREIIAAESLPLVFHCSHGVHRTGTAAAIILSLVGVPWETVKEDYLLSNTTRSEEVAARLEALSELAATEQGVSVEDVDTTNMEAFYVLNGEYIDAARNEIIATYGSFESYATDRLGLTIEELERLRAVLLE